MRTFQAGVLAAVTGTFCLLSVEACTPAEKGNDVPVASTADDLSTVAIPKPTGRAITGLGESSIGYIEEFGEHEDGYFLLDKANDAPQPSFGATTMTTTGRIHTRIAEATLELLLDAMNIAPDSWLLVLPKKQVLSLEHAVAFLAGATKPLSIIPVKFQGRLAVIHFPSDDDNPSGLASALEAGHLSRSASFEFRREMGTPVLLSAEEMQSWYANYQFPLLTTLVERVGEKSDNRFRVRLLNSSEDEGDVTIQFAVGKGPNER